MTPFQLFLNIQFAPKKILDLFEKICIMTPFQRFNYTTLNTCCIQFQDRKQVCYSTSVILAILQLESTHQSMPGINILTSFYLLVLLSNSKPNYHRNILTSFNSIGSPSPVCFISLPTSTSNYLEYYVCKKPPKENPVAAHQISVSGEIEKN